VEASVGRERSGRWNRRATVSRVERGPERVAEEVERDGRYGERHGRLGGDPREPRELEVDDAESARTGGAGGPDVRLVFPLVDLARQLLDPRAEG
jgi:hypothetical protein